MYARIRPLELTGVRGRRSYRVDRIQGATATDETFIPRYAVELSPSEPFTIRPTAKR